LKSGETKELKFWILQILLFRKFPYRLLIRNETPQFWYKIYPIVPIHPRKEHQVHKTMFIYTKVWSSTKFLRFSYKVQIHQTMREPVTANIVRSKTLEVRWKTTI
jgi:hypothetical protein